MAVVLFEIEIHSPAKMEIDYRFFTTGKFSRVYVHERGKKKSAAPS